MRSISVVTLFLGALASMAFGAPNLRYSNLDQTGVRLVTPDSIAFLPLLHSRVNESAMAPLHSLLPYTVIVKNESQRAVAAITLIWSYKNKQGRPITNTTVHFTLAADHRQMLRVGDMWILTPVHAVNQAVQTGRFSMIAMADPRLQQTLLTDFAAQADIGISLDCLVFEDGELIGPDRALTAAYLNGKLRARKEIDEAVRNLSSDGLRAFLAQNSALGLPPLSVAPASSPVPATYEENWYRRTLKETCAHYLALIKGRPSGDVGSFQTDAQAQPPMALIPAIRRLHTRIADARSAG